jgi:hypothetical protein
MSLPPYLDTDRPIPKDPAEAVYSRRRMYALISASIRTSTNSGFTHAMFHHLLSQCNRIYTP